MENGSAFLMKCPLVEPELMAKKCQYYHYFRWLPDLGEYCKINSASNGNLYVSVRNRLLEFNIDTEPDYRMMGNYTLPQTTHAVMIV